MKIAVIGPGALGCLLAASIACRSDHDVWLLDHDADRAAQIGTHVFLEEEGNTFSCPVKVTCNTSEIGTAHLILLCVKSGDVPKAVKEAASLFSESSLLITFQNGIGHLQALEELVGPGVVAIGVTSHGATLAGPGHVRHAGKGPTRIGYLPGGFGVNDMARLTAAATLLTKSGIKTEPVSDIIEYVWNKLLVNVGINALTAIYDCPNGQLFENEGAKNRLERAVEEAAMVARGKGIGIEADPLKTVSIVCQATGNNISSMLQDVRKKRPTEIDAINGAIVHEARILGIPVPENEKLVREIREIEKKYLVKAS
jgi:2-dehydropantoate 2-reductase